MIKKPTVLYICSAGHSGSTLLDLMTGGHPDVLSLGEIVHLPKNIALNTLCSCGTPVKECELWNDVISQMVKNNGCDYIKYPYELNLGHIKSVTVRDESHQNRKYDLKWRFLTGLYLANNILPVKLIPSFFFRDITNGARSSLELFEVLSKTTGCSIVVDSSKSYSRALSLYEQQPENVRILLLTRDARGVQYSNIKRGRSGLEALKSWKKHYSRSSSTLLKTVGKKNWIHIRYEDLVKDPENVLKSICKFADIDFSEEMLDLSSKQRHLTNGNDMRFIKAGDIRIDTAWKEGLSPDDLRSYENIAEKLNKSFGYQ